MARPAPMMPRQRLRRHAVRAMAGLCVFGTACHAPAALERVVIPPGSTLGEAADSLAAHDVIRSTTWFRMRARLAGVDRSIKAGVYEIPRAAGTGAALSALRRGDIVRYRITVPSGSTIFDLAHAVGSLGIPPDALLAAAHDTTLLRRLGIDASSAEGWLLPESFDFDGFDSPDQVIARFVTARRQRWDPRWTAAAAADSMTPEQLLTLASIVEAEAPDTAALPEIAAVYRNRLRLHMALQADPTIEYAWLLQHGKRRGRLYNTDYQLRSPWNTYLHPGLPPGPIGNPGRAAIDAVLHPAAVPYLYFVAGPGDTTLFATTYAGHLRNIRRIRPTE